ncbi:Putative acyl protein synthase/acyl-CoA reductase-like protein [Minicystis rosea]|nr:Putative acyl protein synthase/acyl-CoA reductase-like protein [Minicystis rosea]
MFSAAESDLLHARVRAFMAASLRGEATEPFDTLALDLARFQAVHVPAIARLGRARGAAIAELREASGIPAVPSDVFRLARIAAHPRELDVALFRTSGTSQGAEARGEHPMRTTETYERGALAWGQRFLWPDHADLQAIVLAPPIAEQGDSSLGFMLDRFAHGFARPPVFVIHRGADGDGVIDFAEIVRATAEARSSGHPVLVLATSFALVHLIEGASGLDLRLTPGSRVMQTGGFKGKSREIAADVLRRMVAETFGVNEDHVVSEYGMTELSSQLYEGTLAGALGHGPKLAHGIFVPPPWVRVTPVDPVSLEPVASGENGIGRIVDLANVDSSVAIQTADRVRITSFGIELLGRLPGATPRGCSIAIDEMLGRA